MEKKQAKVFDEFLSKNKDKQLVITTHRKADIDGLASAYALSTVLPNSIIAMKDLDEGAAALAEKLSIKTQNLLDIERSQFDGLIVVDTASLTLLAEAADWNVLLVIDHHHEEGRDIAAKEFIIDEDSPSTAEIVASLVSVESADVALALSAAIISDTARFKAGIADTFILLGNLLKKAGATYTEALVLGEPELRPDVKMAVLKAFQRVTFTYAGNLLIATSEVGSNESDAAQLISEAADIAFVASWKNEEKETRISARARKHVTIPLNEVMKEVGQQNGGAGGGHPKAAGASVKIHTQEALKACVDEVIRRI
jgi:nanoRNase/pAp phosphatase (c-di-AMP/oligoRNAs hydrolase)